MGEKYFYGNQKFKLAKQKKEVTVDENVSLLGYLSPWK